MKTNRWTTKALSVSAVGAALDVSGGNTIFSVSGTAGGRTITSITGGGAGQWVILLFTDANVTVTTAAAGLQGAVNFVGAANDTLWLASYDGTTWNEVARKEVAGTSGPVVASSLTVSGATALNGGLTMDTTAFTVADTSGNTTIAGTLTVTGATALNGGITCDTTAFTVADTSGNTAIAGTLTVTGACAFNGGITCDSTAFTVADTSGNVATTGTLSATGNFAINTNKFTVTASSGNTLVAGTLSVTDVITPSAGIAAVATQSVSPRHIHTGGIPASVNTDGTDATPVNTEVYIGEVFIAANTTITGVSIFNGSAVAGNLKVGLADSLGAVVATSASTAQAGTDAYQRVPFTGTYTARGPATFYVLAIFDTNTTPRFNTHTFGDFGAAKQTGQVFGTGFTTITPPTTFTTALAPIASLY